MYVVGFAAPKILSFDIEARPLGWYGGDWVHKEVTVIASGWVDGYRVTDIQVDVLTRRSFSQQAMLARFHKRYDQADMVTGHYIRGFDLPVLQAGYAEHNMNLLEQKMTSDTKGDLIKYTGVSKSQENIASFLGISSPKIQMNMGKWRAANRLTRKGIALAKERAKGDIVQQVEMRAELMDRGLLGPPKLWLPGGHGTMVYVP